jgi:hypothetical protein
MRDEVREAFLPPDRAAQVHRRVAEALESDLLSPFIELAARSDPHLRNDLEERAILHRLEAGDMAGAVLGYWQRLGNFSRLRRENRLQLGLRVCCLLNRRGPPMDIAAALKMAPGAVAVVNDWGQHAIGLGDAEAAKDAALAAYALVSDDMHPWDKSTLACHAAEALLLCGQLPEAMKWAERARDEARYGARKMQGMPSREVMEAYEHAFHVIMKIAAAGRDRASAVRSVEELMGVERIARGKLAEFNQSAVVPIPGPSGDVEIEQILDGRLAALAARLDGRPADAVRILSAQLRRDASGAADSAARLALRMELLRAQLAAGHLADAISAIDEVQHLADELDDAAARCELASMRAATALEDGRADAALACTEEGLTLVSHCGLELFRNGLLEVRASALLALGRADESRSLLASVRELETAPAPQAMNLPRPRPEADLTPRTALSEPARRLQLHDAAVAVIESYRTRGLPFALYFRKYDFTVSHGPMEFGPRLTENVLSDAMPPGAQVVTIQSKGDGLDYAGSGSSFNRSAPALFLEDTNWQEVAASLIPFADLIVSEAYMLSDGVRFELETAYRANRWDRTVLLLPPLKSPFAVIDNDPLIQMFPRVIWMDSFHTDSLTDPPVIKDLLARMARIVALDEANRRELVDLKARDAAYPVDLMPIAAHLEQEAEMGSVFGEQDDRTRYYGFWQLFRAASIRGHRMRAGDDSFSNRSKLSSAYRQLSAIMLDHELQDDKVVLTGDLTFAEQCARSACALIRESDGGVALHFWRESAERQLQSVLDVRAAVEAQPARFLLRPRFGPFPVRKL